jgi:glycine/D-amino acid oxidase-like deaminating enzyme
MNETLNNQIVDITVIGCGLAGAFLVNELQQSQRKIALIDANPASNTPPVAILHPFPGRKLALSDSEIRFFNYSYKVIKELSQKSNGLLCQEFSVLRPSLNVELPTVYERLEVLGIDGFHLSKTYCLQFPQNQETLIYKPGLSLNTPLLIDTILHNFTGIMIKEEVVKITSTKGNFWKITCTNNEIVNTKNIVLATGYQIVKWILSKKLNYNQGGLMLLPNSESLNHIICGKGHIAPTPDSKKMVVGSTYIHDYPMTFNDSSLTEERLTVVVNTLLPSYQKTAKPEFWHGFRATVPPDKKPLVGRIGTESGLPLYLFTGLASKGLYYAPLLAYLLSNSILNNSDISDLSPFSPKRIVDNLSFG